MTAFFIDIFNDYLKVLTGGIVMKNNKQNTDSQKADSLKEKKIKRRFLAATLGALIVVNVFSLCDFSVVKLGDSFANLSSTEITTDINNVDAETQEAFNAALKDCLDNFGSEIPMKEFNLSSEVVLQLAAEFVGENPQYFYLNPTSGARFSSNYYKETGIHYCSRYTPVYIEGAAEKKAFVEQYVDGIIANIDESMSNIEKALYVHDYLALNFAYDTTVHTDSENAIRDIYNFFLQGEGVCQAYATSYKYIMEAKLGIPTEIVTSSAMGHAWNVIQVDGNWYHVDVTWDDPEPDHQGSAMHEYFMLSDSAISAAKHHDWEYARNVNNSCTDTTYDAHWWRTVTSEIFRIDGQWYSMDTSGQLAVRDIVSGEVDKSAVSINIEPDVWGVWNEPLSTWNGNYTTLLKVGDTFVYNTTQDIYAVNYDGSNKRHVIHIPKEEHNNFLIFGLEITEDGTIVALLKNNPQEINGVAVMEERFNVANVADIATIAPVTDEISEAAVVNWTEVNESVASATEGKVEVSIEENEASLPASVVESAKGKDVELVINIGDYQWSVNGLDVTSNDVADVNLNVSENSGIVPAEITEKYTDGQQTVEVNLAHEGEFGYAANLKVFVGKEYAGKVASILHYEDDNSRLAYQGNTVVDEEGYAILNISHASSYMVVIDDKIVGLPGDADNDGESSLKDYVLVKGYLVGQNAEDTLKLVNVDMDGDNAITIRDGVLMAKEMIK